MAGLRWQERVAYTQKWWIRTRSRRGKKGGQSHGMQPNHDNQIQLMTKAIAGVRTGRKKAFLKCKNFQCGIGTIWSIKLKRVCGWLAVIKTRRTRGSAEQDRENKDGYSRVNELSQPDNLQWCGVMCVNEWGVFPNVHYNLTLLGGRSRRSAVENVQHKFRKEVCFWIL